MDLGRIWLDVGGGILLDEEFDAVVDGGDELLQLLVTTEDVTQVRVLMRRGLDSDDLKILTRTFNPEMIRL